VLARAYGFSSWPALKNHVEGLNFQARRCTWRPGARSYDGRLASRPRCSARRPRLARQPHAALRFR
jgi:hypothetical protein